jgi:hypothetical protein
MTNNASAYTNIRYKWNSAYDVDPLVGSTTIAGYTEMSAFYSSYRVIGARVQISFCNQETFPSEVYCGPSGLLATDPGANSSSGVDWMMNKDFRSSIISSKGGQDKTTIERSYKFSEIYSRQILTDDSFAANVSSNPSLLIYFIIGAVPLGASNTYTTAGGIGVSVHIYLDTYFYSRKLLTT